MSDLVKGPQGNTWSQVLNNEQVRLAQGNNNGVLSTDIFEFIDPSKVPTGKIYVRKLCTRSPTPQDRAMESLLSVGQKQTQFR